MGHLCSTNTQVAGYTIYLLHGIGYDTLSLVHVRALAYNKDPNSNITVAIHATQP